MKQDAMLSIVAGRVTKGLLIGIVVCILIALLLFWSTGGSQERVPYLNVQLLPAEQVQLRIEPDEVLSRPLFWNTRRPVEAIEAVVDEPEVDFLEVAPLEGVRLLGIIAQGQNYIALLEVDGKVERVKRNSTVKQWRVSRITAREVQFISQGKRSLLTLEREPHDHITLERRP